MVHKRALVSVGNGSIENIGEGISSEDGYKVPPHAKVVGVHEEDRFSAVDVVLAASNVDYWLDNYPDNNIYLIFEWDDEE